MTRSVLVVTTRLMDEVETRIDRDYEARRNSRGIPFTREELLAAAEGADALLITPSIGSTLSSSSGCPPR